MRRSGGLRELATIVALVALAAWLLRPAKAPPNAAITPTLGSTPTPQPQPSGPAWWLLALQDLDAHAQGLPGYAEVRAGPIPELPVSNGGQLFGQYCASCHGDDGRVGCHPPITTGPPPDLPSVAAYRRGNRELSLFRTAKYGIPGTGMAPVLATDQELWAITFYVRSLQKQPRPSEERRGQEGDRGGTESEPEFSPASR